MTRLLNIALITLLFVGCAEEKLRKKPQNLLSEKKMVEILTEVQLIEAAISKNLINSKVKDGKIYYDSTFAKLGVTKNEFEISLEYYTKEPKDLQNIYEKVLIELEHRKDVLQNAN